MTTGKDQDATFNGVGAAGYLRTEILSLRDARMTPNPGHTIRVGRRASPMMSSVGDFPHT